MNWLPNVCSRKAKTNARKERYVYVVGSCTAAPRLTARQDNVARRAYIQSEVTETLRPFYCTVCEKQFQNVAQYDEHCNSYAHHHKIRFKKMNSTERAKANSQEAIEKRREKERKREEKELRKVAKAAGVKLPVAPVVSVVGTAQNPTVIAPIPGVEPMPTPSEKKPGFTAGGWSTVSNLPSGGGFKKSGWATVSSPPKPPSPLPPPPPGPRHVTSVPLPPMTSVSGFRSGGWATLEGPPSESTPDRPLTPNVHHPIPPPPEPAPIPNLPGSSGLGFRPIPVTDKPARVQSQSTPQPIKNPSTGKRAEASRSGWQSFNRGGPKR